MTERESILEIRQIASGTDFGSERLARLLYLCQRLPVPPGESQFLTTTSPLLRQRDPMTPQVTTNLQRCMTNLDRVRVLCEILQRELPGQAAKALDPATAEATDTAFAIFSAIARMTTVVSLYRGYPFDAELDEGAELPALFAGDPRLSPAPLLEETSAQ